MKSKTAFLFLVILYLISFSYYKNYRSFLQGGGDAWGYYAYLPAAFTYHDLDNLQSTISKRATYNPSSVRKTENGYLQIEEAHAFHQHTIIKYTYGVALLNVPFFFLADVFCKVSQLYAADAYTLPYNLLIGMGTLFYTLLGWWLIWKIIRRYFSDAIAAIVLITIGLGTNLYFFSVLNLGMSHPYLFALYALCLYATDTFYRTLKLKYAALIGFACGMITIIRPNEMIVLLFPLLWNVFSWNTFKDRIKFIFSHTPKFLFAAIIFIVCLLPQLIYWKLLSGQFIFYSYTNETFDFLHPHLKNGLLGFANGWLSYTPIMFFAVAGLFLLPKYFKQSALASYLFLPVFIYIIYSWWCWQYINGFGSRPMIDTYPIWTFPFAAFLVFIQKRFYVKILSFIIMAFFVFLNLFQTWQFSEGWIWTEDSNWAYYKTIFLKTSSTYEAHVTYDCGETQPDTNNLKKTGILKTLLFDDTITTQPNNWIRIDGRNAVEVRNGYSPSIHLTVGATGIAPQDYIKISCWAYCPELEYDHYKQTILVAEFKHHNKSIRWRSVRLQTKIGNNSHKILEIGKTHQWQKIWFFVKVPHRFKEKTDELNVFVWNMSSTPILIDELQVEWWKKK
jgi:hypothetical protein